MLTSVCAMRGYSTREVAELIGFQPSKVRSFARAGFLSPRRGAGREYRFSFQDIVLLRAAKSLEEANIHPRKVRSALRALRRALPSRRPLTALRITAQGDEVVVRDETSAWQPESGQVTFDFTISDLAEVAAPMVRAAAEERARDQATSADDWFALALDLETVAALERAREAYRSAVTLDPGHVEAHINLGRLLHADNRAGEAEACYRRALEVEPGNATAWFNLGVALEDLGQSEKAVGAYERAIASEPGNADAHYNLARLYEARGQKAAAIRHFARYRSLTR